MDVVIETSACRFANFLLDLHAQALFRLDDSGVPSPVPLGSRAISILCLLVERRGTAVSKQEIMAAVWPGMIVEDNNLTVQMSAIRRALDKDRAQGSCIQTIPGRGYRFVPLISQSSTPLRIATSDESQPQSAEPPPAQCDAPHRIGLWCGARISAIWLTTGFILVVTLLAGLAMSAIYSRKPDRPRLSIVVLPFQNFSGNQHEDYLADSITHDLTGELSWRLWDGVVISREAAKAYKGKNADPMRIGGELGVRYILEGSVRRLRGTLRINAQLISTETRANLWEDHFDQPISDIGDGQEEIVQRLGNTFEWVVTQLEGNRSARERPENVDSFDLTLRARSLYHQPYSVERNTQAIALYEQAIRLDPASSVIRLELAAALLDAPDYEAHLARAEALISEAASLSPASGGVLSLRADLLRMQEKWPEAMAAAQQMIDVMPENVYGYNHLANEKLAMGAVAEAIPLFEKAIQLDPRSGYLFNRLRRIGYCLLMLGRQPEAISWLQRALIANPDAPTVTLAANHRLLAAAYALSGHLDDAHREIAQANHLWPFATVRSESPQVPSDVTATQTRHYQDGLRLAGLRDHADEDADFSVAPNVGLWSGTSEFAIGIAGYTPISAPGVTTVRTADLVALRAVAHPVIIDTVTNFWGRSIPGAIGLKLSGQGGDVSDPMQDRLRRTVRALTSGDLSTPIVTVGWNAERFDGRNLALRLVALGYTHVNWYRGGREAWELDGMPQTEMAPTDW